MAADGVQPLRRRHVTLSARKKHDPGNRGRHCAAQAADRGLGHFFHVSLLRTILARQHHAGLEQHSLEQDAMIEERVEDAFESRARHLFAAGESVVAVHQNFRLHDRHQTSLLAQCGEEVPAHAR